MNELVFAMALIGGLTLFVLVVIAGVLTNPRKGTPGWTMAVGTIFLLLGIAGLSGIIISEQWNVLSFIDDEALWDFTFICLTPASILFAIGFVWDRIRRCKTTDRM